MAMIVWCASSASELCSLTVRRLPGVSLAAVLREVQQPQRRRHHAAAA
eukprot:CAMPEP_0197592244 /NCGR_PEP_ID=MMETSP1326-20131121/14986_1 /TAXON_ID=1155430 /ORGANISM="Genus nov. species nov., Strain RCC2288" /LENGTH=47 /DNA_ID= /DNA_START= /DNA_END= /DNA_ORIENTATION=